MLRILAILAILTTSCSSPDKYRAEADAVVALTFAVEPGGSSGGRSPEPLPDVSPEDCPDCGGTGRSGDGIGPCGTCGGYAATQAVIKLYVDQNDRAWTVDWWREVRPELINAGYVVELVESDDSYIEVCGNECVILRGYAKPNQIEDVANAIASSGKLGIDVDMLLASPTPGGPDSE